MLARMMWLSVVALLCSAIPQDVANASQSLRISVIGGGGMIGQRIVEEALNRGHYVTVIVRDPAKVTRAHERLIVAQGDVLDSAGIAKAVAGQDVVVSAVGTARAANPDYTLYLQAAKSLVDALRSLGDGAPRLIVAGDADLHLLGPMPNRLNLLVGRALGGAGGALNLDDLAHLEHFLQGCRVGQYVG